MHLPATEPEHIVHLGNGAAGWPASDDLRRRFTERKVVALCHNMPVPSGVSLGK